MVLLIFRAVWFASMLAVMATLLYVYAGLPEDVIVQQEGANYISLSKEGLFYLALGLILLINVLVYVIANIFRRDESFRAWFHGLILTLNIFVIVTLLLFNVINGTEKFDYTRIGFMVYGSLGLIVMWVISWPFYSIYRKILNKQSV